MVARAGPAGRVQPNGAWVRHIRLRPLRRRIVILALLCVLVAGLFSASVLLGSYTVSVADFFRMLGGMRIPGASFIVMENKLPRAVVGLMVGMAFGISGAVFQSMLRNPLASPDIIGISYGASAAAVFAIVFFGAAGVSVSVAAVVGALGVALLITALSRRHGGPGLILIGIGAAAFMQAAVTFLLQRTDIRVAQDALIWLTGSLNSSNWNRAGLLAAALAVLLPLAALLTRSLHGLQLGDDTAAGLGFRVPRARLWLTIMGALLAALATAAAGPVAFVAFLSGPIAKRLCGQSTSLAAAGLVGAATVLAADFLAVNLIPGSALPVGVVTGALGAPFLLWLLISTNRSSTGG
ncbi:iron chelate uptake ABC transporter family permease subunit [Paeniglutamicibacter antarcticus]|uniref:Iron chelate uptake ABC transporter family permease subunit n=1 Tax=Arthrobacter terrae TaxID=2935737 RepID=A0A931G6P5_9MICC|nr:iron chelate uptake ABC transporter family permease subunit [Arthrobacter terrae]